VRVHDARLMSGLGERAARLKADLERLAEIAATITDKNDA